MTPAVLQMCDQNTHWNPIANILKVYSVFRLVGILLLTTNKKAISNPLNVQSSRDNTPKPLCSNCSCRNAVSAAHCVLASRPGGLCSSRCTVYPQHHASGKKMPLSRQLQEKSTWIWFRWLWLDYSSVQNSSNSGWSGCTVPISWAGEVLFKAVSLHSLRRCMGWLWNGALGSYLWKKKRTLSRCTEACEEVWVGSRTSASSSLWKPKATTK